jgi:SAM-dependent methyltransferase
MRRIDVAGFEQKFQTDIDPWNYRNSSFERQKRQVLIKACGFSKRGRGLELGCANGETTRQLAPLCLTLTALDGSLTALEATRRRVHDVASVKFVHARLPDQLPRRSYDLIVASEIAYYLKPHDLDSLARRLARALEPGGRIVILHHRRLFTDAAQYSAAAHEKLCRTLRRTMSTKLRKSYPHYEIAVFDKELGRRARR